MTNKEMNVAIYSEMLKAAQEVLNAGTLREVEKNAFTLSELDNMTNGKRRHFDCEDWGKEYAVAVGALSCKFPAHLAFGLANKFARLAGVKAATLTKETKAEQKGVFVCDFQIEIPTTAKELAAFAEKNNNRGLGFVMIDAERGKLAASDGCKLKVIDAPCFDFGGKVVNGFISPAVIKNFAAGVYFVEIRDDYGTTVTNIKGCNNNVYTSRNMRVFPKYTSVYPRVNKENGFITIATPKAFAKAINKKRGENVTLCVNEGESMASLENGGNIQSFTLTSPAKFSARLTFVGATLKTVCGTSWNGKIWFAQVVINFVIITDCDNAEITLCISNKDEKDFINIENYETPAMERNAADVSDKETAETETTETVTATIVPASHYSNFAAFPANVNNVTATEETTAETDIKELPAPPAEIVVNFAELGISEPTETQETEREETPTAAGTVGTVETPAPTKKRPHTSRKGGKCPIKTVSGNPLRSDYTFYEIECLKLFADKCQWAKVGHTLQLKGKEYHTVICNDGGRITLRRESNGKILDAYRTTPITETAPTEKPKTGFKRFAARFLASVRRGLRVAAAVLPSLAGLIITK